MDILALYHLFQQHPIVTTDTRKIAPGSLFFALKGATFNGNQFAAQALSSGAAFAIIDDPAYQLNDRCIVVDDVLATLQVLARYHRDQLQIPIIGITGTNGKTTTKELIFAVLSQKFATYATKGNLNNHIGVPLSILEITSNTAIGIIEMGANHVGEIAFLCSIAKPTCGLITNVGKAHLEGFGSFEGVKQAKGELYSWLEAHKGVVFLQRDNHHLLAMANNRTFKHMITYGLDQHNQVSGTVTSSNPTLNLVWESVKTFGCSAKEISSNLTGAYNLENILAAIAIGLYFGLSPEEINNGIRSYQPTNNRSQLVTTENNTIISDYYNANASSMRAALDNLASMPHGKKAVILGDMFELGKDAPEEHRHIIERVNAMDLYRSIFVGKDFYAQKAKGNAANEFYETLDAAKEGLFASPIKDALVLLKASRGMAFEGLLMHL
ncbi:UDP-N-acetylmuramoyl-tripeptide--D-alanyl-D-alanine ligase [Olivibacter ginsenosidimutans]|uniref:UDP-N-acetylmuramoyl-tripeptide--D-alanyl-D-alanine ligase n=1 Tax=Olivibacter ginsenosidimutans TaxID=1176537 RepID=A0ABP9AL85_9SPHI